MSLRRLNNRQVTDLVTSSDDSKVAQARAIIDERRLHWLLEAVAHDHLEPGAIDGEITLPLSALELIEKEEFTEADLRNVLTHIGRDNLGHFVALLRSTDEKIRLEAFKLLHSLTLGDISKVEHTGPSGGPQQMVIELVAPGMRRKLGEE